MGGRKRFTAVIEEGKSGGAYVAIPFDVEKEYGARRVKVNALIDGEPYKGSLIKMMGGPGHILGILKEIRKRIGKDIGDRVTVFLEEDSEPLEIVVPEDLAKALSRFPRERDFFNSLSFTNRKEYVAWIEEAKNPETRKERITKTVMMLTRERKKS